MLTGLGSDRKHLTGLRNWVCSGKVTEKNMLLVHRYIH